MKKTFLTLLLAASTVGAFAQGTLQFANNFAATATDPLFRAYIYGPETADPTRELHGNSALGSPVGTQVYTGALLLGTGYTFALWGGSSADGLTQVATTGFRTTTGGLTPAASIATIPNVPGGGIATLQVRVWDNRGGTVDTWAKVLADPSVARGSSEIFQSRALGGGTITPPNMYGWVGFNIHTVVPEPSTIALGVLGLGSLLLFRRRQAK
jgi:hypothetical protein